LLCIAALAIAVVCILWFAWPRHPSGGDPGNRILDQLRPVSRVVPPNTKIDYAHYSEPFWDSCDGMAGTFGWDDPSVQVEFGWSGSPTTLIDYARGKLARLGWGAFTQQEDNGLPGAAWTKTLGNGTTAHAQLGASAYGGWFIFAQAPPLGHQSSGC
jgi:hypothetical protein